MLHLLVDLCRYGRGADDLNYSGVGGNSGTACRELLTVGAIVGKAGNSGTTNILACIGRGAAACWNYSWEGWELRHHQHIGLYR